MEQKISLVGLVVNLFLGIAKIVIGLISNSTAILAEGIHSGMDVISSGINYIGIKLSKKPPDEEHPYGHYKAEVISGFVITIVLFLTGLWIIYEAITSFLLPEEVAVTYLSVGIMSFSAIINAVMSHLKIKYGKKYDNISLLSDGIHDKVDVLTSIVVLIGLFVSHYINHADSMMAAFIGLYILKESFSLGKKATDSLLDVSAGGEIENKIKQIVQKKNIKMVDLKTQKRGSKISANISITLPNNLTVEKASEITKEIERDLTKNIKNIDYVAIQIESHEISESYYKGDFGKGFGWQRRGKNEEGAFGPGGFCICPKCNYKIKHKIGIPCSSLKCPNCKKDLIRES